jgi:hypothetical protein
LWDIFRRGISELTVEDGSEVNDSSSRLDRSPLEAERSCGGEAEKNVLDTLEKDKRREMLATITVSVVCSVQAVTKFWTLFHD